VFDGIFGHIFEDVEYPEEYKNRADAKEARWYALIALEVIEGFVSHANESSNADQFFQRLKFVGLYRIKHLPSPLLREERLSIYSKSWHGNCEE
jgi:hypothetical protein